MLSRDNFRIIEDNSVEDFTFFYVEYVDIVKKTTGVLWWKKTIIEERVYHFKDTRLCRYFESYSVFLTIKEANDSIDRIIRVQSITEARLNPNKNKQKIHNQI